MRMTIKEVSNNYAIPRSYNAIVTRIFTVHSVIFWICIIYVAVSPCFPVYSIPIIFHWNAMVAGFMPPPHTSSGYMCYSTQVIFLSPNVRIVVC